MTPVFASAGSWRAAVVLNEGLWTFEVAGWLEETVVVDRSSWPDLSATVEVRRAAGGLAPCALVGGEFESQDASSLSFRVASSGPLAGRSANLDVRDGFLGQALVRGLPDELAGAVLRGLSRESVMNKPGVLSVRGGGYDPVESSEYAFERAAWLLKWVLLASGPQGPSAADLGTYLAGWGST